MPRESQAFRGHPEAERLGLKSAARTDSWADFLGREALRLQAARVPGSPPTTLRDELKGLIKDWEAVIPIYEKLSPAEIKEVAGVPQGPGAIIDYIRKEYLSPLRKASTNLEKEEPDAFTPAQIRDLMDKSLEGLSTIHTQLDRASHGEDWMKSPKQRTLYNLMEGWQRRLESLPETMVEPRKEMHDLLTHDKSGLRRYYEEMERGLETPHHQAAIDFTLAEMKRIQPDLERMGIHLPIPSLKWEGKPDPLIPRERLAPLATQIGKRRSLLNEFFPKAVPPVPSDEDEVGMEENPIASARIAVPTPARVPLPLSPSSSIPARVPLSASSPIPDSRELPTSLDDMRHETVTPLKEALDLQRERLGKFDPIYDRLQKEAKSLGAPFVPPEALGLPHIRAHFDVLHREHQRKLHEEDLPRIDAAFGRGMGNHSYLHQRARERAHAQADEREKLIRHAHEMDYIRAAAAHQDQLARQHYLAQEAKQKGLGFQSDIARAHQQAQTGEMGVQHQLGTTFQALRKQNRDEVYQELQDLMGNALRTQQQAAQQAAQIPGSDTTRQEGSAPPFTTTVNPAGQVTGSLLNALSAVAPTDSTPFRKGGSMRPKSHPLVAYVRRPYTNTTLSKRR